MAPTLYYAAMSPPCRSVRLAGKALGLTFELKEMDLMKGENMTPEFLAINPLHTVPALVDGEVTLCESRSIIQYLANKYGKKDAIYPKEPKLRAKVDQMIYFDFGSLYPAFYNFLVPVMRYQEKPNPDLLPRIHEVLELLDNFLEGHFFVVGNRVTIADHVLVASVSSMEAIGVDMLKYSNVKRWLVRCKEQMPGYEEANGKPAEMMGKMLKAKMRV